MARVDSPCIGICELNLEADCCKGCFRTRDEVASWSMVDDDERRTILENTYRRRRDARQAARA
ncbi:MAG: DUF1289 domain-containing protein [Rhodospirillaceae bacterium]